MPDCIPEDSVVETSEGDEITNPYYWVSGVDISPDVALNGVGVNAAKQEAVDIGLFKDWRLATSVLSRHWVTSNLAKVTFEDRHTLLMTIAPKIMRKFSEDLVKFDIGDHNFDRVAIALSELSRTSTNGKVSPYIHTGNPIPAGEMEFVISTRQKFDRLWKIVRGYETKAIPILKELGIDNTPENMRAIQDIQEGIQHNLPPAYYEAADRTRGMLDIKLSNDLGGELDPNKWFSLMPMDQEKTALQADIKHLQDTIKAFPNAPDVVTQQTELANRFQRLNELQVAINAKATRTLGTGLPSKQFFAPLSLAKDPAAAPFLLDKNPVNIMRRAVWGAVTKRYFDKLLFNAALARPRIGDVDLENYLLDWINMQRGVKGYLADGWIRQLGTKGSRLLGRDAPVTEDQVRTLVADAMKFQVLTKLFTGIRFPVVNSMQSVMTVLPIVRPKIYGQALVKAMTKGAWMRARAYGVLGEAGERFMMEAEALQPDRWIDRLIKWNPLTHVAEKSEQFNRVVAFEAGRLHYLETGKSHPALRTAAILNKGKTLMARANANGRAMVDTTQFILSRENRPLGMSGGALRRMLFQFRTFGVAYSTLMVDLWKHDKAGFGYMAGMLGFIGGLPAFPMYDFIRHHVLKHTGINLPENNGFSTLASAATFGMVPEFPLDVTGSVDPFNLPRGVSARDLISSAAGPTFGPFAGFVEDLSTTGLSPQAGKSMLRMLSPSVVNIGESIMEYQKGGVHTPGGRLIVNRTPGQQLAHGAGLFPSATGDYYKIRRDLMDAMYSGRPGAADKVIANARKRGIVITERMKAGIRSQLKGEKKKFGLKSWTDILGR